MQLVNIKVIEMQGLGVMEYYSLLFIHVTLVSVSVHSVGSAASSCLKVGCDNNARCEEKFPDDPDYNCVCAPGYTGRFCETTLGSASPGFRAVADDCGLWNCNGRGECGDETNGYMCECFDGFYGSTCQNFNCPDSRCDDHGQCAHELVGGYICICNAGYTGTDCATEIDECLSNPCEGGVCIDAVNGYSCVCNDGYTGKRCETIILNYDFCMDVNCNDQGTCVELVGGYMCNCATGFTGKDCETNIDECKLTNCSFHGRCEDLVNRFVCHCNSPFTGDECEEIDINECNEVQCNNQGKCTQKSVKCDCSESYTGGNCETDVDECNAVNCNNHGRCIDFENGVTCDCNDDYTGQKCETYIVDCEQIDCTGHGDCVDGPSGYQCVCQSYYTGRQCETSTLVLTIEGYTGPVTEGESLNLTCHTDAQAKVMYMWFLRTNGVNSSSVAISRNKTYRISQITVSDVGEYSCVVDTGSRLAQASVDVEVLTSSEAQAIKAEAAQYAPILGITVILFVVFMVVTFIMVRRFYHKKDIHAKLHSGGEGVAHEFENPQQHDDAKGRGPTPIAEAD